MARAKLVVVTALICLFSAVLGGAAAPAGLLTPVLDPVLGPGGLLGPKSDPRAAEQEFIKLINIDRLLAGLPGLAYDQELTTVARQHAETMAGKGAIFHNELLDAVVSPVFRLLGENVGAGSTVASLH
ncbi:MAG: CAP domain-containing protein, partial [Actinomycetota bacterium]